MALSLSHKGVTSRLLVGRVRPHHTSVLGVEVALRGRVQPDRVLGWTSTSHVVFSAVDTRSVYSSDLRGGTRRLVDVRAPSWSPGIAFASGLWSRTPVHRPGPAHVTDPRLIAVAAALAVALAAGGLALRRRRALT